MFKHNCTQTDLREQFLKESTGLYWSDDDVMAELIGEGLQSKQIKKVTKTAGTFLSYKPLALNIFSVSSFV